MIRNELKSLWNNKLMIVVLCAIILIPAMYAGFFLASMWDPYGELEYLPVAVVNDDKPVNYNGKELKIGDNLAKSLKDNDAMAFNVVDEKTAAEGLANGTYYMVITIDENFSQNATTMMTDGPKKMVLKYETNPGKNYISMKLTESAVKEIKENIKEEVIRTYTEEVFENIQKIGDGFDDAVAGTVEMVEGEEALINGNNTITENLKTLEEGGNTLSSGLRELNDGLISYTDGVTSLNSGMATLKEGADSLAKDGVSGAGELAKGTKGLKDGISDYTSGAKEAGKGASTLVKNNKKLNEGMTDLSSGVKELKEGSGELSKGLKSMQKSLNEKMTAEQVTNINNLADKALPAIKEGIDTLNEGVSGMDLSGLESLGLLKNAIDGANSYVKSADDDITKAIEAVKTSSMSDSEKATVLTLLGGASVKLNGVNTTLNTASGGLDSAMTPELSENIELLKTGVGTLAKNSAYITTASDTIKTLLEGTTTVQINLNEKIVPGMEKIDGGIESVRKGVVDEKGLKEGVENYTSGVQKLYDGLKKITRNNKKLNSAAGKIQTGASSLYDGLSEGVGELTSGAVKLAKGSSLLTSKNATLLDGMTELKDGTSALVLGAGKLHSGSEELGSGIDELLAGTNEMKGALADGEEEIRDKAVSDDNIEMFISPVETEGKTITNVENNGHAMAAYMMSVGLWVACLAFCLMYPLSKYEGKLSNGFGWWASKAVILYPMGMAMVLMLMGILNVALGFNPESMGKTILIGLVATACFMSIMYFFNFLLGKVGSFLMLLFMVLQLAGSAGTYPLEISGNLANVLHKWVPFTYSVDAFRSAISGGQSVRSQVCVLFVISLVFTLLTILVFCVRAGKIRKDKKYIYGWLEEKGLA